MAVVTETAAEVAAGTMGPRMALEGLVVLHDQYANFCQMVGHQARHRFLPEE